MTIPTPPGAPFQLDARLLTSFTLAGTSLLTYAWHFDLKPLLWSPDPRGEDTIIDGVPGGDPNPRRGTVSKRTLEFSMNGYVGPSSATPVADPWAQWVANWIALRAVCDPLGTGDGTRAAAGALAGSHSLTGPLTSLGIVITEMDGPVCQGTFACSLPRGALVLA